MADLSGSPYYDDYDSTKDYAQILAVPGRVSQARDITQLQSIQRDYLGRLGSSLYTEGSIISGCSILIDKDQLKATISSGSIFLNGLIRNTLGTDIDITGNGLEVIGVRLDVSVVTEEQDQSLYDSVPDFKNTGQAGSHRLKESITFVVNDPTSTPVFQLQDGELISSNERINSDNIVDVLARRTYDENGSYKIRGIELRDRKEAHDDKIYIDVTEGKAYVRGYELNKFKSNKVELDRALDVRTRYNESHTYSSGSTYKLAYQPVRDLASVSCLIEYTTTLTRGELVGGVDDIRTDTDEGTVDSIVKVVAGNKEYQYESDYLLTSGGVDWSPEGDEPDVGTTYNVTYKFNQKMSLDDFELVDENGSSALKFKSEEIHPVDGSKMYIDYNFYLNRIDLVTINSSGEVKIHKGEPDTLLDAKSPINNNIDELVLGTVLLYPNSDEISINNFDTIRLDQHNLYNLRRRVDNIEYNIAMSDLDQEAIEGEPATQLRGVFTDGFIGLTKCDLTHEDFNCSIDVDNGFMTVPQHEKLVGMIPTDTPKASVLGGIMSLDYDDIEMISQTNATDRFRVNEYAVFHNMALIELDPYIDNWVDSTKLTVDGGVINESRSVEVNGGTRTNRVTRGGYFADYTETTYQTETSTRVETSTRKQSEVISDESIYYMRPITITVTGSNYIMNSDNLECTFNGTHVDLTPLEGTEVGTNPGTVKCDSKGRFSAQFTIPEGVPCGSVEVLVINENNEGGTIFTAQGRKQVIQETVFQVKTTVTTTTKYTTVTTIHDPLAQAFYVEDDSVLTKVGLYFAKKDEAKNLVLQVRNLVNGYPGPHIYDQVVVDSEDVKTSEDGSVETQISLAQPVYLQGNESYCFALLSDSDKYELWTAVLGHQFVDREEVMLSQPYPEGVMFSSSNALTWNAHQDSDLKFKLYRAEYKNEDELQISFPLADFHESPISGIVLAAQTANYRNSVVRWSYKENEDESWKPIQPFTYKPLDVLSSNLSLRCSMSHDTDRLSPFLNQDSINLIGFRDEDSGTYLSRTVTMDQDFNNIKASFEGYVPDSAGYQFFYSTDANNETWTELTQPKETDLGEGWKRYEFEKSDLGEGIRVCKVKLMITSSNPLDIPMFRKLIVIMKEI